MRRGIGSYTGYEHDDTVVVELKYVSESQSGNALEFWDGIARNPKTQAIITMWLPASKVDDGMFDPRAVSKFETVRIEIPYWLAYQKGLI